MKTSCAGAIRGLWDELNQGLFPGIDDNIGELDARHRLFRTVCEAVIRPREFAGRGFTDAWFAEMIVKHHGDIPTETVSYDSAPVEVRSRAANAKRRLARIDPDQPLPPSPISVQGARTAEANMAEQSADRNKV